MRIPTGFAELLLLIAVSARVPDLAQEVPAKTDETAVVAFGQKAAAQALDFREGDAASLQRARPNFTPEGWADFMKHMQEYLASNGAPTFSSSFAPSREAAQGQAAIRAALEEGFERLDPYNTDLPMPTR